MSESNGESNDSAFEMPISGRDAVIVSKETGQPYLTKNAISKLSKLGVDAEEAGLVSVATGGVISSMGGCEEMQQMVLQIARDAQTSGKAAMVLDAAMAFSLLVKAMQGCAAAVKADGLASKSATKKTPRRFSIIAPDLQKTG